MMAAPASARLCDLIDVLRRQHRAGITPSFGQVDELFELADEVRTEGCQPPAPRHCAIPYCGTGPLRTWTIVGGRPYCYAHGLQVDATLASLQRLLPELHAALVRADWPTQADGRVTGPDPRD